MHTNLLINETSPYLLQHAHNPVNWLPWGEAALARAREEDKVILVSIGYSACHWCHVMERESFEDEATAGIMNRHFINIKIDREERPDIDHIYMDAVQAMTGAGGWPLNVFLTPDARPFYGGTYFPPVKAYGRSSWKEILYGIAEGWQKRRTEIEAQATQLTNYLQQSNDFGQQPNPLNMPAAEGFFTKAHCQTMFDNIMKAADTQWGGFGKAPKFPQTFTIAYLLAYHHFTGEEKALEQALLSVDKMLEGGICDQAGGGFCRYSTDTEWLAPHFEKMLYDNALILSVLCDAFAITGKKIYEKTICNTIAFVKRELMGEKGGFYAALDADSEGVEGRFYVWEVQEVREVLGPDADLFCSYFDITEKGNWEEKNILRVPQPLEAFAAAHGVETGSLEAMLDKGLAKLLEIRSLRIRPGTDDKLLLGWNALMISALCKAAAVLGEESYKADAVRCFDFLWEHFRKEGFECYHTFKNDQAKYPAFLDDYASLIRCCIDLQEITSQNSYFEKAKGFTEYVMNNFADTASPYFFYTGAGQRDVIVRKKEVHDGATASGNSLMAGNLRYLGIVFNRQEWIERSGQMLQDLQPAIMKYPSSFGVWAGLILQEVAGYNEIALIGEGFEAARSALGRHYLPNKILQCSLEGDRNFPLLEGKKTGAGLQFYLCKSYSCQAPETELSVLLARIRQNDNF